MKGVGVGTVKTWMQQQLPPGPSLYPKELVSEHPERFFVSEIIRERVFMLYEQEVPYSVQVRHIAIYR
jgi:GTPase